MNRKTLFSALPRTLLVASTLLASTATAAMVDKSTNGVRVRLRGELPLARTTDVVLLAVGTSMRTSDYDKLATEIANRGYIVAIMDHNPGNMIKTSAARYSDGVQWIQDNMVNWVRGSGCEEIGLWIVGGHSAGGQAAQEALSDNPQLADAIFSIDPYNCNDVGEVDVPAMYWGIDATSCFVGKDDAAKAGFYKSQFVRAFYQVNTRFGWSWCGYSPEYFHCSFADDHCPGCTNCKTTPASFFVDVAESVDNYITALVNRDWSKQNLQISGPTPHRLYIDNDRP